MSISREMGASADQYRQMHGFPCGICYGRVPKSHLCGIKIAGKYVQHCLECARKRRTADREARLAREAANA